MDISKFNQELGVKIAKARAFEKFNEFKKAVKLWIEVSEMIIAASKTQGLDFSYKNMLITKTQQILEHIKDLKSPKRKEIIEEIKPKEVISPEQPPLEVNKDEPSILEETEIISQPIKASEKVESNGLADENWMDKVDFSSPPKGIVEINPPKDFKIVTPHDPNYVDKMKKKSEEIDMGNLKIREKKERTPGGKIICFACGEAIVGSPKICPNCGVELK
ncbi:MAG: hypothetical protein EU529_14610 [Promethearchaeota archaeon]|nr:MAG: hypothetical protein EU529_14610 [Candidatus Lokiarchaeota archaeon]